MSYMFSRCDRVGSEVISLECYLKTHQVCKAIAHLESSVEFFEQLNLGEKGWEGMRGGR